VKGVPAFERVVDRTVFEVAQELKTDRTFGHQVLQLTADLWNRVVAENGDVVILEEDQIEASPAHALLLLVRGVALVLEEDIERTAHQARAQSTQSFHNTEGVGNVQVGNHEEQCSGFGHGQFCASGVQLQKVFHRPNCILTKPCRVMDVKAILRCKLMDGAINVTWIQGVVRMMKVCLDRVLPAFFLHAMFQPGVYVDWFRANAAVGHGRARTLYYGGRTLDGGVLVTKYEVSCCKGDMKQFSATDGSSLSCSVQSVGDRLADKFFLMRRASATDLITFFDAQWSSII
jgi:hypothetical protein